MAQIKFSLFKVCIDPKTGGDRLQNLNQGNNHLDLAELIRIMRLALRDEARNASPDDGLILQVIKGGGSGARSDRSYSLEYSEVASLIKHHESRSRGIESTDCAAIVTAVSKIAGS